MPSGDIICDFDLSIHKRLKTSMGDPVHTRHLGMAHLCTETLAQYVISLDSKRSKVQNFRRLLLSPSPFSSWVLGCWRTGEVVALNRHDRGLVWT